MVKAAYSSGRPAIGVGAGNVPAIIDETADVKEAVNSIIMSKTFDHGLICASEQATIVVNDKYDEVKREFLGRGAHFLSSDEKNKVLKILFKDETSFLNLETIGRSARKIAEKAGIDVPASTKLLVAEVENIGPEESFSREKLSPILAMYSAKKFEDAVDKASKIVGFGGMGHTSALYTDLSNQDRIRYMEQEISTARILINMPSTHGAIGDLYNFRLEPSLTLGCGSWGNNSISENIGVKHLLNIETIAEKRENMLWFRVPPKIYFKYGSLPIALADLNDKKKALIITDKQLFELGFVDKVTKLLSELNIDYEVFHDVEPDPTISTIKKGLTRINSFEPDVIIA